MNIHGIARLKRAARRLWGLQAPPPRPKTPDALRLGLVGMGGVGQLHASALNAVENVTVSAVCDIDSDVSRRLGETFGVRWYTDFQQLLRLDEIEAVMIGTPPYLHAPMTLAALETGKHVLVEKPVAVSVREADQMIEKANEVGRWLGVCHQYRTFGRYQAVKQLLEGGTLGAILRVVWISCGLRPQAYYDSGAWRGTWWGEGGGVLVNQAIHDLDLLCWLFGEPVQVFGQVGNLMHEIEVEDIVSGTIQFRNGAFGVLQMGTIDTPGSDYIEIVGDKGTVKVQDGLRLFVPSVPLRHFIRTSREAWGLNQVAKGRHIPDVNVTESGHAVILRDFAGAIRQKRSPFVDGSAGRLALEIANGMILSGVTGRLVDLPIDRDAYDEVLSDLREGKRVVKRHAGSRSSLSRENPMTEINSTLSATSEQLAILGGPRAVTVLPQEHWPPPVERIKSLICQMIDEGVYSLAGSGLPLDLEKKFAAYIGTRFCLSQNNGTSTLWAAYYAIGIKPGDEVLHPGYTWISAIAPAVHLGARPVFCEIDPGTLTIDPADAERRITSRTRAISIVHLYGNVCDMDGILALARKHNLAVIEDCSHAYGAEWDGKKVGSIGDIGCFSMQGDPIQGKPLPAGEGGLITTNHRDLYERVLFFGHLNRVGIAGEVKDSEFRAMMPTGSGLKFRAHPWAMAMGIAMLDGLDDRNERRRQYRKKIYEAVAGLPGLQPMKEHPKATSAGFYGGMHFLYTPDELGDLPVEVFIEALRAEGVDMFHRGYELTHRMKLFAEGFDLYGHGGPLTGDYPGYPKGSLPVTEAVHPHILGMPTFIQETSGYSDQVIDAISKVTANYEGLLGSQRRIRQAMLKARVVAKAKTSIRNLLSL